MPPSPSPPPQLPPPHPPLTIPVLLLKTRSHPHDAYEEYFSSEAPNRDLDEAKSAEPSFSFVPQFVPVLEHRPNTENLGALKKALESGALGQRYGGMIFTSQRAVEAWAEVVKSTEERHSLPWDTTVDGDISEQGQARTGIGMVCSPPLLQAGLYCEQIKQTNKRDPTRLFHMCLAGPKHDD